MTDDLVFDRAILEAFHATAPTTPSDIVDRALTRTADVPQRRPRLGRLDARAWPPARWSIGDPSIRRNARLLLLAAAIALVTATAVVGAKLLQDRPPTPRLLQPTTLVQSGSLPAQFDAPVTVLLGDGRVLAGGYAGLPAIAYVLDPVAHSEQPIDSGLPTVNLESAALLPDGRVALLGWDQSDPSAEGRSLLWVFDPRTNRVGEPVPTLEKRFDAAMVAVPDGRVLITGGIESQDPSRALATTELFDPTTRMLKSGPPLTAPRTGHIALATTAGTVLLVGGNDVTPDKVGRPINEIELFDHVTGGSEVLGHLGTTNAIRSHPRLLALADGRVLIVDRQIGPQLCGRHGIDPIGAQMFDPTTQKLSPAPPIPHSVAAVVALTDGRVLVAGSWQALRDGCAAGGQEIVNGNWLGLYDPATGATVESTNPITHDGALPIDPLRPYSAAVRLADGSVLLFGSDLTNGDQFTWVDQLRFEGGSGK